jgi:hypothetical protein
MTERALPLLSLTRHWLTDVIQVTLPEACDAAMIRDGVQPKKRFAPLGDKADWLAQILGAVPPARWVEQWDRTPAQWVALARDSEWSMALLLGWTVAAERHRHAEWAEALLAAWLDEPKGEAFFATWVELASVVPGERLEALLLPLLGGDRSPLEYQNLAVLLENLRPWSTVLTRAVLKCVRKQIADRHTLGTFLGTLLATAGRSIPPSMVGEAAAGWPTDAAEWSIWAKAVSEVLDLLRFRHDMLEEIAP